MFLFILIRCIYIYVYNILKAHFIENRDKIKLTPARKIDKSQEGKYE